MKFKFLQNIDWLKNELQRHEADCYKDRKKVDDLLLRHPILNAVPCEGCGVFCLPDNRSMLHMDGIGIYKEIYLCNRCLYPEEPIRTRMGKQILNLFETQIQVDKKYKQLNEVLDKIKKHTEEYEKLQQHKPLPQPHDSQGGR